MSLIFLWLLDFYVLRLDRQYNEDIKRQKDVTQLLAKAQDVYETAQLMQKVIYNPFSAHRPDRKQLTRFAFF